MTNAQRVLDAVDGATLGRALWQELARAASDREHAWRTPVLATVDTLGMPQARTVVLREVDADDGTLAFYTDRRSPKVLELARRPQAVLVFWSARLRWQLRASVHATVQTHGPAVDRAWTRLAGTAAAADYLAPDAPGSLPGSAPPMAESSHGFARVQAQVLAMDWLELRSDGHRRARLAPDGFAWVTP